jgi:pre-mRNA-splicing factor RBM22/SLT11
VRHQRAPVHRVPVETRTGRAVRASPLPSRAPRPCWLLQRQRPNAHSSARLLRSFKKTVICREVALAKNVCQCCILDLETGLPVQVRDAALGKGGNAALPESDVGKEYALQQMTQAMADGTYKPDAEYGQASNNALLRRLQRTAPYYKRNRAKICTFWLRNACTRADCPFRPCNGDTDMPELNADASLRTQNMKDRYNGVNDPVAEKMMRRAAGGEDGGAGRPDPLLTFPEDSTVTTLYVGGLDERVEEGDLRMGLSTFGDLASVRVIRDRHCAFVTFAQRSGAEDAARALASGPGLVIHGLRLKVMWGKPKQAAGGAAQQQQQQQGAPPMMGMMPPHMMMGMPPQGWAPGGMPPMPGAHALYPSMDPSAMGTRMPTGAAGAPPAAG